MRTCHKHSCAHDLQAEFGMALATEKKQHSCFTKLFREGGMQVSLVTMSCSSPRTVTPPCCFLLDIKDSLKEDTRFFLIGNFDWLPLTLAVVYLHQSSFLHQELYT
jgi:hypothetical protein